MWKLVGCISDKVFGCMLRCDVDEVDAEYCG